MPKQFQNSIRFPRRIVSLITEFRSVKMTPKWTTFEQMHGNKNQFQLKLKLIKRKERLIKKMLKLLLFSCKAYTGSKYTCSWIKLYPHSYAFSSMCPTYCVVEWCTFETWPKSNRIFNNTRELAFIILCPSELIK